MSQTKTIHEPVLIREVLDTLRPNKGDLYLDLTAGYGGHASSIINITDSMATLVDRDENSILELEKVFKGKNDVEISHGDFLQVSRDLVKDKRLFDLIFIDLGVSSPHLDSAERGFSFMQNGPLDMRMDNSQELTASDVVNDYDLENLRRIISDYGEEPKALSMAKLIIRSRPLDNTQQLSEIAKKLWPGHSRTHPATRLFQAIRIEVNDELGQLKQTLPLLVKLLAPGGRLGIISFHSLEDRIVKKFFKERAGDRYDSELVEVTKRPLQASKNEIAFNPRSRSAKLRVVAKIKTKKEGKG